MNRAALPSNGAESSVRWRHIKSLMKNDSFGWTELIFRLVQNATGHFWDQYHQLAVDKAPLLFIIIHIIINGHGPAA